MSYHSFLAKGSSVSFSHCYISITVLYISVNLILVADINKYTYFDDIKFSSPVKHFYVNLVFILYTTTNKNITNIIFSMYEPVFLKLISTPKSFSLFISHFVSVTDYSQQYCKSIINYQSYTLCKTFVTKILYII